MNKKIIIAIVASVVAIAIIAVVAVMLLKNNKKFSITFDTQGGNEISAITVKVNETFSLPKDPEKEGYVFLGWFDKNEKPILNGFVVKEDVKLTAKWAEVTQELIKISFDTDGGTPIEDLMIIKGETLTLPENPTKEGYIFKNWVDVNETPIYDEALLSEDTILKAVWEKEDETKKNENKSTETKKNENKNTETKKEYIKISFDSDGGSKVEDITVEKGKPITLPNNPTKAGYRFITWKDKHEVPISNGALLDSDIHLKAVWEKIETTNNEKPNTEDTNVEATGITLNKNTVELIYGKTATLVATVSPSNAKDKSVTWSSSNNRIVDVDASGKVQARGIGEATITAKTANGKTATATVYADVESVTILTSKANISNYGSAIKTATLTVKTEPSITLDSSMYKWYAPDTSGSTAAAGFTSNGKSATISARDCWSYASIPVQVSIGRKTSKIYINVEPELKLTHNMTSGSTVSTANTKNGTNCAVYSNVNNTDWEFNTSHIAENIIKQGRQTTFKAVNTGDYPNGFVITATTGAGQKQKLSVTVNPK